MKSILIAFQFLTRIPIQVKDIKTADYPSSMMWFPIIGLFIGLILAAMYFAANLVGLSPEITAAILILILVIITGGLHLDGLSDAADGLYGGKNKDEILKIMDDSHIGAIGAIAIGLILLLKYSVLVSLLKPPVSIVPILPLILAPVISRWGMVIAGAIMPPAKKEGLGSSFLSQMRPKHWIIATLITYICAIGLMHLHGFILCMAGLGLVIITIIYIKQKIDGVNGDILGAINEIVELGVLFASYIIYKI